MKKSATARNHSKFYSYLFCFITLFMFFSASQCRTAGSDGKTRIATAPVPPLPPLRFENSRFGIFATHAPEFQYFEQRMGFNHSRYWEWADQHVQELGAHWTRSNLQLMWDICQPFIGGPYNWNNECLTDSVIVNVYEKGNELNWLGVFQWGPGLRDPLEYPAEYHQFVKDAVERFDGDDIAPVNSLVQVKWWQIGNEVIEWRERTPGEYVEWLRICEDAIHEANVAAKIVLIAPLDAEYPDSFLCRAIQLAASEGIPFDAIDMHGWGAATTWLMNAVPKYRRMLDRLGLNDVQIWSCENGTWAYGPTGLPYQPPVVQARFVAKRYAANLALGVDKLFTNNLMEWYNFGGNPGSMFNCMGLIGDGALCGEPANMLNVPRPSYATYGIVSDFLDIPTEIMGPDSVNTLPEVRYSYLYQRPGEPYPFQVMWNESISAPYSLNLGTNRALLTPLVPDQSGKLPDPFYVVGDSTGVVVIPLGVNPIVVEAAPMGDAEGRNLTFSSDKASNKARQVQSGSLDCQERNKCIFAISAGVKEII